MNAEVDSKKEIRIKRRKVAREFRLKNLKKVADKNLALHKLTKKNMIQAMILAGACIFFGIIFIFLAKSPGTSIVENSIAGVGSLMAFLVSVRDFMTPSADDDCIALKFSDVCRENVDLSLTTTDEDDIRNTEKTIEYWCTYLQIMKSLYNILIMFSSLLFIVFIILDFTLKEANAVPVNITLIAFGGMALIGALINRYLLKMFTFSGDGGKDIERLINGVNIHIKRRTTRDLKRLIGYLSNKPSKSWWNKFEKCLKEVKEFIEKIEFIKKFLKEKKEEQKKKKLDGLIDNLTDNHSEPKSKKIAHWIWKLWKLEEDTDLQPESHIKELRKKLSLKEIAEIIQESIDTKYPYKMRSVKLTIDHYIRDEFKEAAKEFLETLKTTNQETKNYIKITVLKEAKSKVEESKVEKSKNVNVLLNKMLYILEREISEMSEILKVHDQNKEIDTTNLSIEKAKKNFDKIENEISKMHKALEAINLKTENSIKSTDPTSEKHYDTKEATIKLSDLFKELKKINQKTEKFNNFTDPMSAERVVERFKIFNEIVDKLSKESEKLDGLTNPTLELYETEKELSKMSKILEDISNKTGNFITETASKTLNDIKDESSKMIIAKFYMIIENMDKIITQDEPQLDILSINWDSLNSPESPELPVTKWIEEVEKEFHVLTYDKLKKDLEKVLESIKILYDALIKVINETMKQEKLPGVLGRFKELVNIKNMFEKLENEKLNDTDFKDIEKTLSEMLENINNKKEESDNFKKDPTKEESDELEKLEKFSSNLKNLKQLKELHVFLKNEELKGIKFLYEKLKEFISFKELHDTFKEINELTEESIANNCTYRAKDKDIYLELYDRILDAIEEAERQTKFQPISCYIDFGKHFGTHLFLHRDSKKRIRQKKANKTLIRCYYRLGQLLFSDNDGDNAPFRVTDVHIRKAQNIYNLYNQITFMNEEKLKEMQIRKKLIYKFFKISEVTNTKVAIDRIKTNTIDTTSLDTTLLNKLILTRDESNKKIKKLKEELEKEYLKNIEEENDNQQSEDTVPINTIKEIETRYAVTIFALSSEDVTHLIDTINDHNDYNDPIDYDDPIEEKEKNIEPAIIIGKTSKETVLQKIFDSVVWAKNCKVHEESDDNEVIHEESGDDVVNMMMR